jgi:hypothetical protein
VRQPNVSSESRRFRSRCHCCGWRPEQEIGAQPAWTASASAQRIAQAATRAKTVPMKESERSSGDFRRRALNRLSLTVGEFPRSKRNARERSAGSDGLQRLHPANRRAAGQTLGELVLVRRIPRNEFQQKVAAAPNHVALAHLGP